MDEGGTRGSQRGELHELIGKCTSCLLCTPAIQQRDRGDQRVNQGQSERQWDCKQRVTQRRHRIGLGRINWNALFRMVYSVLVEWNASSLTRAMAGGAGLHGRLACNGWWRGVGACNGWRRRVAWQPPSRECRLSVALGGHSEGQCTCESQPKARGRWPGRVLDGRGNAHATTAYCGWSCRTADGLVGRLCLPPTCRSRFGHSMGMVMVVRILAL